MRTGFYDLSKLSLKELKNFFTESVALSYDSHVDILDCKISFARQRCTTKTVQDMLDNVSKKHHNVCIDRQVQHPGFDDEGEIGYSTLLTSDGVDYFLYIHLTTENLYKLIKKYELNERVI